MVREDDERGVLGQRGHGLAHDGVHAGVGLAHGLLVLGRLGRVVHGVLRIQVAPEHVRRAVRELVDLDVEVPVPVLEEAVHHLLVGVHGLVHVGEELRPRRRGPRRWSTCPRPSHGLVEPEALRGALGVVLGVGDGHAVVVGVEVDRGHVEAQLGLHRQEVEPRHALEAQEPVEGELEDHPVGPLPDLERPSLTLDVVGAGARCGVPREVEGHVDGGLHPRRLQLLLGALAQRSTTSGSVAPSEASCTTYS